MSGGRPYPRLPSLHSVVAGIGWPAIGSDAAAHRQSLLFQLEHSQWLSSEELQEHQLMQLKSLLRHAVSTVPHYAESFCDRDIDGMDWAAFETLPMLDRKDLQADFSTLRSSAVPTSHGKVVEGQSSGSTGTPVRFLGTAATQLFWEVLTLREHLWQRRDFAGKLAAIRIKVEDAHFPDWGAPVATISRSGPAATLSIRTDVAAQLDWLRREDPDYLITHASNLGALAQLAAERGIRLPRLRQARTYSEALRPGLRAAVRTTWGVEIADVYSCEEAGVIALQCPDHANGEHYHIQSENLVVEILDEQGRPCTPGQTGEVVLTTLHNFAMPLIRYRIGDHAEVGAPCACGRGLPVLRRIHGRQRNMVVLPDGRRHWPSFPAELWTEVAPVEQFRLVQHSRDEIEACYVMARELGADEAARIVAALQERFGCPFRILLKRVDAIERGPGYKFEDFVSLLTS